MNSKKLYTRVFAIFGTFMVFFYLGLGYFLIFSHYLDNIEKPMRVIFGIPLIIYGVYRAFTSYQKIRESFFDDDDDE